MSEPSVVPSRLSAEHFRNPDVSAEEASALAETHWGIRGEVTELGSMQDRNFRLAVPDGGAFVLRIANGEVQPEALTMELAAMRHLGERLGGVLLPEPVVAMNGEEIISARGYLVRMMTWIPGATLGSLAHLTEDLLHRLGQLAGRCTRGLEDFEHPAAHRFSQWDTRVALDVLAELETRPSAVASHAVERGLEPLAGMLGRLTGELPCQVVHSDLILSNLVTGRGPDGGHGIAGLIDFGDIVNTWRICDVASSAVDAIACNVDDPLATALSVLGGYRSQVEMNEAEVNAFWPVVLARAALCTALCDQQALETPDNSHAVTAAEEQWRALEAALSVRPALARAAARSACGLEPVKGHRDLARRLAAGGPAPILAGLDSGQLVPVDLGISSERLVDGYWGEPKGIAKAVKVEGVAAGRWAEVRLPHAGEPAAEEPEALHLGVDLFTDSGTEVLAPLTGRAVDVGERELTLACLIAGAEIYLRLAGLRPALELGTAVARGEVVGVVAPDGAILPSHLHVQVATDPHLPGLGRAREREAWLALCPDPSPLLGVDAAAPLTLDASAKRDRRARVIAAAQRLHYRVPLEMVRGWRDRMYDARGRPYLDAVNNVATIGHSHPSVTEAARRQFRLLNTNSRFLYDAMTEYAERISALLPEPLDTVFIVNSGSEALDLATQLACAFTGRRDLAVLPGAYHGWTEALFQACTDPHDKPAWRETIPSYVHVVEQPDPYRGQHGDDSAAYIASVQQACTDAELHGGLAAFLSEALLGNQGAIVPPPGYLAGAYDVVRAAGGLCIADEVQVGYARTGSTFWAFEHEGVVPDIVAAAKATGNGHPIGVVVCRREIADAFARQASFFSSTGGGPVSCRIGLAVLDVIRDEGLQNNAARVGSHLKQRIEGLAESHELIGAINGRGLYLGIDLVRDRSSREPAADQASVVCERMRELGVIVQPFGDANNVLKVKPPLCIGVPGADYFISALGRALHEQETVDSL